MQSLTLRAGFHATLLGQKPFHLAGWSLLQGSVFGFAWATVMGSLFISYSFDRSC